MSTFSIMGPHNTDLPDPFDIFPIDDTAVCFIKNVVTTPNVEVGEVLRDRREHQVHHGRSESQRIDGVDLSL